MMLRRRSKVIPRIWKVTFFYVIFVSQNVKNIKILGYYRRAASLVALGKFKQALSDYELVCKRCPSDEDAKTKFTECNKMVKKIAFEKAIAVDKVDKTLAEVFKDLESIAIEDDYVGPKLENGNVTVKFMEELLDWYKNQKKLHRKYAYKVSFSCNNQFYKKITTKILDFMWRRNIFPHATNARGRFDPRWQEIHRLWRYSRSILRFIEHF